MNGKKGSGGSEFWTSIYLQLLRLGHIIALAVQIVRVEGFDGLEHLLIMAVHELTVGAFGVPWVEGVVAYHGERLRWQRALLLGDVVEILVVSPAQHDVVEAAAGGIDAVLGAVDLVIVVSIGFEGLVAVDDLVVKGAADWEGVADDVPLALGVEEVQQLAKVVYQARELHPAWFSIFAHRLGSLQEMLDLGERGVRVGLVDEGVELLHGFPDRHLRASLGSKFIARSEVVGNGLLGVLFEVEVLDFGLGVFVLTELGLVFFAVEFGLFVDFFRLGRQVIHLLSSLVFEDVDLVNLVRDGLEGDAIALGVELLLDCYARHFENV
jgi:hypothetical protein